MAKTFKEIQAEVMELARKNDMDEADAMRLLRSRVKAAGLKMPKGTATDAQAMQQQAEGTYHHSGSNPNSEHQVLKNSFINFHSMFCI